jgi:hypothetical protein
MRLAADPHTGLEMAKHKSFTVATDVKVYFCVPQSPWQRGTNENTNGLLGQDLSRFMLAFAQKPRCGEVYNLGGGFENSCSILEAFALAVEVSGTRTSVDVRREQSHRRPYLLL